MFQCSSGIELFVSMHTKPSVICTHVQYLFLRIAERRVFGTHATLMKAVLPPYRKERLMTCTTKVKY